MRLLLIVLVLVSFGCAGGDDKSDVPSDITDATSDVQPTDNGAAPPQDNTQTPPAAPGGETSEQDLQNNPMATNAPPPAEAPGAPGVPGAPDNGAPPPPENIPAPEGGQADNQTPPAPVAPAPEMAAPQNETPPPPPENESASGGATTGEPATLTGLDFKGNVNGGTIVIRTDKPIQFTTRKNDKDNQFIIDLHSTSVPSRFKRPYDTKEFPGPIAAINAYQSKGAREGHIVVQLRDNVEPAVTQDGNIISVAGGGGTPTAPSTAEENTPPPPEEVSGDNAAATSSGAAATNNTAAATSNDSEENEDEEAMTIGGSKDSQVLANHTLADFLTGNTKFVGRPISLEVKDEDIRDVFRFISEETGLNMVVGDDVQGKITLKLRRIPWDQALSIILQSKQLGYVKQGNVLRIATLTTLQRESDSAKQVIDAQRQLEPLHVQVFPISYAKSADMEAQAKDFLSPRGKVRADPRTNNLVVTDIDENLGRIRQLVKRLDTQTPQVLIEGKIVEARESFESIVGVNWGFSGDTLPLGANNNNGGPITLQPNGTVGSTTQTAPYLAAGFSISNMDIFGNLSATLALLESESLVKVISAPRIVTLDRVPADIKQTTQFPIFATQTSGAAGTTSTGTPASGSLVPQATVTFQDVNLELKVTPQITMDGSIIMAVDITREFPDAVVSVGGSQARPINKRSASTQVLVENGDTVVIGGIYQSDVTEGEQGVPGLSKIPIIGALFRQRSVTKDKNELVIFLTPRILNREKAFLSKGS